MESVTWQNRAPTPLGNSPGNNLCPLVASSNRFKMHPKTEYCHMTLIAGIRPILLDTGLPFRFLHGLGIGAN